MNFSESGTRWINPESGIVKICRVSTGIALGSKNLL